MTVGCEICIQGHDNRQMRTQLCHFVLSGTTVLFGLYRNYHNIVAYIMLKKVISESDLGNGARNQTSWLKKLSNPATLGPSPSSFVYAPQFRCHIRISKTYTGRYCIYICKLSYFDIHGCVHCQKSVKLIRNITFKHTLNLTGVRAVILTLSYTCPWHCCFPPVTKTISAGQLSRLTCLHLKKEFRWVIDWGGGGTTLQWLSNKIYNFKVYNYRM